MKKILLMLFVLFGTASLVNAQTKKAISTKYKINQITPVTKTEAEKIAILNKAKSSNTEPTDAQISMEANKRKAQQK